MECRYFLVDAFTDRAFGGNQAAVFIVDADFPVSVMQRLAAETNCAESAFVLLPPAPGGPSRGDEGGGRPTHVPSPSPSPSLRWFTPLCEVALCGHATLASAAVLFELAKGAGGGSGAAGAGETIFFDSASGTLAVSRAGIEGTGAGFRMDFPADTWDEIDPDPACAKALGLGACDSVLYGRSTKKAVFIVDDPVRVESLAPDFRALLALSDQRIRYGVGVSAPGRDGFDFESRYFNPWFGVDEDSVTGSVHTLLGPWWGARLGKTVLKARQLSPRGGQIGLECAGDRILLSGQARIVLRGALDGSVLRDCSSPEGQVRR